MSGNFSFGDYFKEQAITFAWELLTTSEADGGLGFDPKDLWVTVYEDDDEAREIWKTRRRPARRAHPAPRQGHELLVDRPARPGGPCSEIFFDRGPAYGIDGGPATDDDRYVEIWNLVFMQYLRGEGTGKADFEILGDLPKQEHRHRHGPRARRLPQAGRREHVRDRPGAPGARPRRRSSPAAATAPTTTTTCGCASSPTTCAARSC